MFTLSLSHNVTYSSPFYDYAGDFALYVGDDSGYLEQIINVFTTPNNTTTPTVSSSAQLSTTYAITSPVFDITSGCVFVGDTAGHLYKVTSGIAGSVCTSSFGTETASAQLGSAANEGIIDAPLVDSTNQGVYAFVTENGSSDNAVYRLATGFLASSSGQVVTLGSSSGGASYYLYAGTFDNVFYASGTPAGNLWEMANTGLHTGATLYSIALSLQSPTITTASTNGTTTVTTGSTSVASSFDGASVSDTKGCIPAGDYMTATGGSGPSSYTITLATAATGSCSNDTLKITGMGAATSRVTGITASGTGLYPWPSPLTEFCNNGASACATNGTVTTSPGVDYIFFSVNASGEGGCTNTAGHGCVISVNVTTPTSPSVATTDLPATTPGATGCWATGGLIIDNSGTTTGASNIYFVGLNGAAAGNPFGTKTSTNCTTGTSDTPIVATQASQAAP
jgi:hypothetical protein